MLTTELRITTSSVLYRSSPDLQRGEKTVDLCGSDPGPCSLQTLIKVGRSLWIQTLLPGLLNQILQARDAVYCLI